MSMRKALSWLTLGIVAAAVAFPSFAQGKPDFSGAWVAQTPTGALDPLRLVVTQPLAQTTARGDPMPPRFRELIVEKIFTTGSRTETHLIGIEGGTIGGLGDTRERVETKYSVAWDGDRLRLWNWRLSGSVE